VVVLCLDGTGRSGAGGQVPGPARSPTRDAVNGIELLEVPPRGLPRRPLEVPAWMSLGLRLTVHPLRTLERLVGAGPRGAEILDLPCA